MVAAWPMLTIRLVRRQRVANQLATRLQALRGNHGTNPDVRAT